MYVCVCVCVREGESVYVCVRERDELRLEIGTKAVNDAKSISFLD